MMLLPQIAWESQRALTHSVLAPRSRRRRCWCSGPGCCRGGRGADLLFGAVVGLGMLAKANFVFVPVALGWPRRRLPELRRGLQPGGDRGRRVRWRRRSCVGPAIWALRHPDVAFASTYKLRRDAGALGGGGRRARGSLALAGAVGGFLALPVVVLGLLRWRCGRPAAPAAAPVLDRFLLRTVVVGLALVVVAVLVTGATNTKDRWLQPVLYLAAPVGDAVAAAADERGGRALARAGGRGAGGAGGGWRCRWRW